MYIFIAIILIIIGIIINQIFLTDPVEKVIQDAERKKKNIEDAKKIRKFFGKD